MAPDTEAVMTDTGYMDYETLPDNCMRSPYTGHVYCHDGMEIRRWRREELPRTVLTEGGVQRGTRASTARANYLYTATVPAWMSSPIIPEAVFNRGRLSITTQEREGERLYRVRIVSSTRGEFVQEFNPHEMLEMARAIFEDVDKRYGGERCHTQAEPDAALVAESLPDLPWSW